MEFVLGQIKDSDNPFTLHFRFATNMSVLRVEDGFSVTTVNYSIIHDQPQNSHLCIIPVLKIEISSNNFSHTTLPFLTMPENPLTKGRLIRSCMSKQIILDKINSMISGRQIQSIMSLKRWQCGLLTEKVPSFFPCFFPLISLIDHILIDRYLSIVDEGGKLFIDQVDKVSRKLSGNIDVFYHLSLIAH